MRAVRMAVLFFWAMGAAVAAAQAPIVVDQDEIRRLGDVVQYVGAGPRGDGVDVYVQAMAPPASDADKWFISVLTMKGCPACEKLKQAFQSDPWLRALANPSDSKTSWSHYNVYRREDETQAFRFTGIKVQAYPTILVQPPRSGKYGDPGTVVFQGTYGGSPEKLARDVTSAIRAYVAKLQPEAPRRGHGSGPRTPAPPFQPPPIDETPLDVPAIDPIQIPTIPPVQPETEPAPATPAAPANDTVYPEAIVILDADDGLDGASDARIRRVLDGLRKERGKNFKVRFLDWAVAKDKFPVSRDEVPVVLLTEDGKIADKISGRLLPYLETQRREVGILDLPWSSILALFTTGFSVPAVMALAVWLIRFIRARRIATGQPVLLDDAQLEQVLTAVQSLLDSRNKPPSK